MASISGSPLSGLAVLIVEDEFLIAIEAQRIVEECGAIFVELANSLTRARAALAAGRRFDVAILDLKLGVESGQALMADLRAFGVPVVVATGLDHRGDLGGARLVHKPYRDAEIVEAILAATGRGG